MKLKEATPSQLQRVYEADLRPSFPAAELKPLHAMETMWAKGAYSPLCLFDGETIIGECFVWLGRPGWMLLDYLCVSSCRRGKGLGSAILEKLRAAYPRHCILAESEAPSQAPDPELAERRLGFYARSGARTAGFDTEMFGVRYRTLYWAQAPVADEILMDQHRYIYQSQFPPEKYDRYVRIPWTPDGQHTPNITWEQ